MSKQFADISTRREYILGLTEVICQIFEIADPDRREAVILELEGLDDAALIEKQEYLEGYFKDTKRIYKKYSTKVTILENHLSEQVERDKLSAKNIF